MVMGATGWQQRVGVRVAVGMLAALAAGLTDAAVWWW